MICLEWWTYEILALSAGFINVEATGAMVILLNIFVFFLMFPMGFSVAASACVGSALGQGNSALAIGYVRRLIIYAFVMGLLLCSFLSIFRVQVAEFFTTVDELKVKIADTLNIVAIAVGL